jgi:hypothetical protein
VAPPNGALLGALSFSDKEAPPPPVARSVSVPLWGNQCDVSRHAGSWRRERGSIKACSKGKWRAPAYGGRARALRFLWGNQWHGRENRVTAP